VAETSPAGVVSFRDGMENRVFFPQLLLDQSGIDGKIDLSPTHLILLAGGRRYKIEECVHVVLEVTGANDEHKLVGKVKPKGLLEELGAEIMENSMILGDNAYDVVPGWAGVPEGPFVPVPGGPATEEEMLRRFSEGTS
jgi:hypothetical protein